MPASVTESSPTASGARVNVTEKAIAKIRELMVREHMEGGLRLGVRGGGCSGLTYAVQFDSKVRERDHVFEFEGGVRLLVDPKSLIYLSGMTLDYENTLIHQGFVFQNPNATRSCGCGTSFMA